MNDESKIIVLPTVYRDVHFRSRLEARWAVYFDMIGVSWQYEPEGYQLDCGNYCPDFLCEGFDGFFVEVKPTHEAKIAVEPKLRALARMTGKMMFCVIGTPSVRSQWGCGIDGEDIDESIFCHYAFTIKRWGIPYFGDTDAFEKEPYWHRATNMRFNNGVCAQNRPNMKKFAL